MDANSSEKNTAERSQALATVGDIFESGRTLSYVRSAEEQRLTLLLREAASEFFETSVPVLSWSVTQGFCHDQETAAPLSSPETKSAEPRAALEFIANYPGSAIFHLKDFHIPMESPEIRRHLRDLYLACFDSGKFMVITSPIRYLPEDLSSNIVYIELTVPDLPELIQFIKREAAEVAHEGKSIATDESTLQQLARAVQGLSLDETRHALRRGLATHGRVDGDSIPALLEEKRLLVNRSGMIEFISDGTDLGSIGGLDYLKNWLLERRKLFQQGDEISAEIVPKGLLIMGISGCGKSLSVKAVAQCFELPLYRIDMTEIFSGRHGKPEGAFVQACRMLEQMAPAVVWFDEIEMGITSSDAAGEQGRLFAFFLTWMQEKARGLFVAATANRIDLLPAEMIRKGRFDEVFFVDIPLEGERVEIFRIHLERRGINVSGFDLERLKRFTKGWTGAEIEQCVVSALTTARLADRELDEEDILNATANIVPLSKTMKEQVDQIRAWAYDRAVRASPREGMM